MSRTKKSTAWLLSALALLGALAVVGCGGDNGGNPSERKPFVKFGKPAGENPTGVVMLLHGGGWQPNPQAYPGELTLAGTLQGLGYATVVVGYGTGAQGFQDVKRVYEKARRRYPGLPICVYGISAGGTLGLMLAAREPDLTCVVGLVTPTDLTTAEQQGGETLHNLASAAFGEDQLAKWSPARFADKIRAKVLLMPAQTDPVVPIAQAREFVRKRPSTQLYVIPAGSTPDPLLHGAKVSTAGAQASLQLPFTFIAQAFQGG